MKWICFTIVVLITSIVIAQPEPPSLSQPQALRFLQQIQENGNMTTPSVVQSKLSPSQGSIDSVSLQFDSSVTAGNLILVFGRQFTVSDTTNAFAGINPSDGTNTYTQRAITKVIPASTSHNLAGAIWTATAASSGAFNITVNPPDLGALRFLSIAIVEVQDWDTLTESVTKVVSTSSSSHVIDTFTTTTDADYLIIGQFLPDGIPTKTPGGGYSELLVKDDSSYATKALTNDDPVANPPTWTTSGSTPAYWIGLAIAIRGASGIAASIIGNIEYGLNINAILATNIHPELVGNITYDLAINALMLHAIHPQIAGDISYDLVAAGIMQKNIHPEILGDVSFDLSPAAQMQRNIHPIIVGSINYDLSPAAVMQASTGYSIFGDIEYDISPNAVMDHQIHPAIVGSILYDVALNAAMAANIHPELTGDISFDLSPAAVIAYSKHPVILGDINYDLSPNAIITANIHAAIIGDISYILGVEAIMSGPAITEDWVKTLRGGQGEIPTVWLQAIKSPDGVNGNRRPVFTDNLGTIDNFLVDVQSAITSNDSDIATLQTDVAGKQASSALLTAIAALSPASANTMMVFTGADSVASTSAPLYGRQLLSQDSSTNARSHLALGNSAVRNVGTGSGDVSAGNHLHSGTYEPANANIQNHITSLSNPHSVSAAQLGLGTANTVTFSTGILSSAPGFLHLRDTRGSANDKVITLLSDSIVAAKRILRIQARDDSYLSPTDLMSVTDTGEVGIGTLDPAKKFHAIGPDGPVASFPSGTGTPDVILLENAGNCHLSFVSNASGQSFLKFFQSGGVAENASIKYVHSTNTFHMRVSGTDDRFRLDTSKLHITGSSGKVPSFPTLLTGTTQVIENNNTSHLALVCGLNNICGISGYESAATVPNAGIWFGTTPGSIQFRAGNVERMRLTSTGLGINTPSPSNKLHLVGSDNSTVAQIQFPASNGGITASDTFIAFTNLTETVIGDISGTSSPGVIAYNTFTGSHFALSDSISFQSINKELGGKIRPIKEGSVPIHSLLISLDEMADLGDEIDYLPKVALSTIPEDNRVYGVYGGHNREGKILVLSIGAGRILVTNSNGAIVNGDFLCSSAIPGHAMKYLGNDMRKVIAKARQSFPIGKPTGTIACTYMAG